MNAERAQNPCVLTGSAAAECTRQQAFYLHFWHDPNPTPAQYHSRD